MQIPIRDSTIKARNKSNNEETESSEHERKSSKKRKSEKVNSVLPEGDEKYEWV